MKSQSIIALGALSVFFASTALAEETEKDKSQYHLFNRTPDTQMREWRTDQAGASPYTVDAGHFEMECSGLTYGLQERSYTTTFYYSSLGSVYYSPAATKSTVQEWTFGQTTVKAGLLNNLDAEMTVVPYTTATGEIDYGPQTFHVPFPVTFPARSTRITASGVTDIASRLKLNLWGNDGGKTALSLSGAVTFPTGDAAASSHQVAGGPAIEFAAQLPFEVEMRIDSAVWLYESIWKDRVARFENLISFSHQIIGQLSGFCLFDTKVFTESTTNWRAYIVPGFNYRLTKQFDLFARSDFGLNGNGNVWDFRPSFGFNVRF